MSDKVRNQARVGRCSWLDYARILRSIHDGVTSTIDLAAEHGLRAESMREVLRRMLWLRLVHVSGSTRVSIRRHIVPTWALGESDKPPFPTNAPLRPGVDLFAASSMWKALQAHPRTSRELAELCGLHDQRVAEFCKACAFDLRVMHVVGYRNSRLNGSGTRSPVYALGFDQPNAERPAPKPARELWSQCNRRRAARRRQAKQLATLAALSSIFRLGAANDPGERAA